MRKFVCGVLALVMAALAFNGCSSDSSGGGSGTGASGTGTVIAVTEVKLSESEISLTVGETKILSAAVLPSNAADKTVTWDSDNKTVATVDNGTVKALAAGSAKISAKAGGKTAYCSVTVNKAAVKYTVSFDTDGAGTIDSQSVPENNKAVRPADPEKEGFTFAGWYNGDTKYDFDSAVTESLTLKAKWTAVLQKIVIKNNPTKTTYFVGDAFDSTGLEVEAVYSNGDKTPVTGSCSSLDMTTAGAKTVTVTYEGKTAEFTITVQEVVLSSIKIKTEPAVKEYFAGDTLNTTGLVAEATYNNGKTEVVNPDSVTADLSTAGTKTVTVTYGGKSATYQVTVKAIEVVSIAATAPTTTSYTETNPVFSADGIVVKATYNNGETGTLDSSLYTVVAPVFDTSKDGIQSYDVVIKLKANEAVNTKVTVTYSKTPVTLSSISIKSNPAKTTYFVGDTFDSTGLEVEAVYSNGNKVSVTGSCSSPDMTTAGAKTVTVTYEGKTAEFTITVQKVVLSSIGIKTEPAVKEYFAGDTLNTTGLVVEATYNNGKTEVVTPESVTADLSSAGTKTVTVTYGGKSASYQVTVKAVVLSSISIKTEPAVKEYFAGDSLNTAGLVVQANYNNGKTEVVTPEGVNADLSTAGTKTVTVTYGGKSAAYQVTVKAVVVSSIKITTEPSVKEYYAGDTLNTEGLVVEATYNNGSKKTVTNASGIADLSTAGTKTVTVTYEGKTATYTVTVINYPEASISVTIDNTQNDIELTLHEESTRKNKIFVATSGFEKYTWEIDDRGYTATLESSNMLIISSDPEETEFPITVVKGAVYWLVVTATAEDGSKYTASAKIVFN